MKKPLKKAAKPVAKRPVRVPAQTAPAAPSQPEVFEDAVKLMHAGDFVRAKQKFDEAARGSSLEMAHAARAHARMCEHRIAKNAPQLNSAEDHYNFAITLMNQRSLESAEQHLGRALEMSSGGDHVYYALALCRGLRGDVEGACKHLKRAIELQPRNRVMARNDPDFIELSHYRALAQVLYPEGTRSS